jgi:hypothetical protein
VRLIITATRKDTAISAALAEVLQCIVENFQYCARIRGKELKIIVTGDLTG